MKTIEKYIQFWIENGLIKNFLKEDYEEITKLEIWDKNIYISINIKPWYTASETFNLIELITSKEFIGAIARGINKIKWDFYIWRVLTNTEFDSESTEEILTTEQAIAIRDGELEEFITKLLNNE